MAKVTGFDKSKKQTRTHSDCGAIIEYYDNEVKYKQISDYGGGSDRYGHLECPNCKKTIQWCT